jgi:WD40 repeat protein
MARGERPLDAGAGVLLEFAADLRRLRTEAGSPTYQQLASRAHYSVATLSTAANGRKLPSLAVTMAYVKACDGDTVDWEKRWHATAAALAPAAEHQVDRSPYAGLAAFQVEDSPWFFGRERQVAELVARLTRQRFAAVFGASGVGKSSLLRAGLAAQWLAESPNRAVVLCTPGAHPLTELEKHTSALMTATLVVVDQFEEIFTVCRDEAERDEFITTLLALARQDDVRVIIGVRADFYTHCTRHTELLGALADAQIAVGPMNVDELRRTIVEPARRADCTVETTLLTELIAHTSGQDGVLPMLSHALRETWHRRRGNTLTLAGFQAAGGIDGALARTAESVYATLDDDQRNAVRNLFMRLCALGEGTEDTKRRIGRDELPSGAEAVLDVLADARLITLADSTVDITHEALIRAWPRLQQWLAADRDALRTHRQLTEAAQTWSRLDHDPGALYRGARLAVVREWTDRDALNATESAFLDASVRQHDSEIAIATRRTRRMRRLTVGLAVLLVAVSLVSILALQQRQEAVHARELAVSRQLATQALTLAVSQRSTAKLLSVEAFRTSPTFEARSALMSMSAHLHHRTDFAAHAGAASKVVFAPDGHTLVSAGRDGVVAISDATNRRRVAGLTGHRTWLKSMALSPDGRTLATGGNDHNLVLWDLTSRSTIATLSQHTNVVRDIAFSPDGQLLATASDDRTAMLWDVRERKHLATLTAHTDKVTGVKFSPDGRTLATTGEDKAVMLWDVPGRTRMRALTGHSGPIAAVAFSPDGGTLATAGDDRGVHLWNLANGALSAALTGHGVGRIVTAAFSPDGRTLATGGLDDTVILWDTKTRVLRAKMTGLHTNVYAVTFNLDGTLLASAGEDGKIVLWDTTRAPLPNPRGEVVNDVAFSPSGNTLLLGGGTQAVAWDVRSRVPRAVHTGPPSTAVTGVAFHPDGDTAALSVQSMVDPYTGPDNVLTFWDRAGTVSRTGHQLPPQDVTFSPDGRTIATGGSDNSIVLWDTKSRTQLATLDAGSVVNGVTFSPDGRTIAATVHEPNVVMLWDTATHQRKATFQGHDGWVGSVRFSPDGKTIASSSADETIILWDASTGAQLQRINGANDDAFTGLAFGPDGRTLAFTSADHTVLLWDITARAPITRLTGHNGIVRNLAFSPDGATLASAADDGTVVLWDTDAERVARHLCATLARDLTETEWAQFIPEVPYRSTCQP